MGQGLLLTDFRSKDLTTLVGGFQIDTDPNNRALPNSILRVFFSLGGSKFDLYSF